MTEDRRAYVRLRERLDVVIRDRGTGRTHRASTRDLAGVGVCLITEEPIDVGTPLEVELKLLDYETPVKFLGQVVWSRWTETLRQGQEPPTEIGVRFMSIDEKDRALIIQYATLHAAPSR